MTAIGQIDVEKSALGETWTNRYLVDIDPTDADSVATVNGIVSAELLMLYNNVTIVRARHSTIAPDDDNYVMTIVGELGARGLSSDFLLPLFNVVRVDFHATAGRPSRKYLRGCLAEGDVNGDTLITGYAAAHSTPYINAILALAHIVDPQGDELTSGQVWPKVAMRQLRRGSRRRTEPVLGV